MSIVADKPVRHILRSPAASPRPRRIHRPKEDAVQILLFGGELILSNVGSVGKCFIVPRLPCKMTLAPNAVMVRMMEQSSKEYLYYFLISSQGYKELDAISTGVAVKKFNKTELRTILIPLPPLAEQKRIVERISELLAVCDELKIASKRMEL